MNYRRFLLYTAFFLALQGTISAQTRDRIKFSGFTWYVRSTVEPEGPRDNFFGGLGTSVDMLADGALRLSVVNRNGTWYSAEVWTTKALGYGTYTFRVRTPLSQLHPDVTLGLFTYSQALFGPQSRDRHRDFGVGYGYVSPRRTIRRSTLHRAGAPVCIPCRCVRRAIDAAIHVAVRSHRIRLVAGLWRKTTGRRPEASVFLGLFRCEEYPSPKCACPHERISV